MKLKKKVNIKQDTETFILSKGGNRELKVSGTKSPASRNHTAFIMLLRIMSSEEGAIDGGYRGFLKLFYKFFYSFKSHLAGRWLSFYSDL